ncbi:MAG TPA: selenide, water dikinase SelD, partial [Acidimicrobiales bacterium]|nr:selenide, water dikinase SelD [Acidimicrobiales bacterium]
RHATANVAVPALALSRGVAVVAPPTHAPDLAPAAGRRPEHGGQFSAGILPFPARGPAPLVAAGSRREGDCKMTADEQIRLTEWTSCGGCAAKWGAAPLAALLRQLATSEDTALLVGLAPFDDAAVYRLSDDAALVSTTDFFPPLVDDPSDFGAIAAANACSDVFAMGGRVVLALNISAFPERLPVVAVSAILAAASEVVRAAGGVIAGGHTIRSEEPIFGLAVQGLVHPDRVWSKAGARPGDRLLLSKPIGTGIVLAGADAAAKRSAIARMRTLNRDAAEALARQQDEGQGPHAVTDVTGFGLLGHAWEMAERSDAVLRLAADDLPLYEGARAAAAADVRTGGDVRNRAHLETHVQTRHVDAALEALAYDPQTSGGLLAAVAPATARPLVDSGAFVDIGEVVAGPAGVELVSESAS